jgi:predicted RNA-binding protein YlxR (DUF448 family)
MPRRTCIGCGLVREKGDLLRFVSRDGFLTLDRKGIFKGRGVYLCNDKNCIAAAYKKENSFSKALKTSVTLLHKEELWGLINKLC